MTAVAPPTPGRSSRAPLGLLLAVSYVLRVCLALRGGQGFWPDEARYGIARDAVYAFAHRQWGMAFKSLLGGADHVFFRWIGLPIAAVEYLVGGSHPALAACYFSLFSVGAIFLVWAVARRAGASEPEALWSAFFAATANSLFYYSRHYLPYDAALFGMLLSLLLALGPGSSGRSFLVGVAAGFGFLTYNGYWLLGGCILGLHALLGAGGARRLAARASMAFLGLLAPIALFVALGAIVSGGVIRSYRIFAGTVKQGDFHVGFRVVPEYLWASEGPMLVLLIAAFAFAFFAPATGRRRRLLWWAAATAGLYAGLVFFSDVVPVFMVYGRLSRCLVPFLCLGAGAGVAGFLEGRGPSRGPWTAALLLLVAALGAINLSASLSQVFPDGFPQVFARKIAGLPAGSYGFYRMVGTEARCDQLLEDASKAPHDGEFLRRRHPLQFRPYQFEGFTTAQRRSLNSGDVAMRVLKDPMDPFIPGKWDLYPGPVKFTVVFPRDRQTLAEPLVSSGRTGIGDVVFVRYVDPSHVQFGQDHWGAPPVESKIVEVDYSRPHQMVISAGSLLPPGGTGLFLREPWLEPMRRNLLVMLDGRVVLSRGSDFYADPPASIVFGANLIGGSATEPGFSGAVSAFGQASLDEVSHSVPGIAGGALARERTPEWAGSVGPVRIRFEMPSKALGREVGQPLASVECGALKQVLFVIRDGDEARFGLDTFGSGPAWSEPFSVSGTGAYEADVSFGSLLPDKHAPIYGVSPGFAEMRSLVYVRFQGRLVLLAPSATGAGNAAKVVFGANVPGSTACAPFFMGEIPSISAIGLRDITVGRSVPADVLEKLARPGWGGYPGPLRMGVQFADPRTGATQPILTTGVSGSGDVVFIQYEPEGMARICLDHWGAKLVLSEPFVAAPGVSHELTLSLGSLFPPGAIDAEPAAPGSPERGGRIKIVLDGRTLLDRPQDAHAAPPGTITLGANFIGGSSTGPAFFGKILSVDPASP